jgi:uncharacterized Tic20 family protein
MSSNNSPKKNRYIAATLHFLFLISKVPNFINIPIILGQHPKMAGFAAIAAFLIIARPLITLMICSELYKENLFVYLATRDIMNSVFNQLIISSLIVFVFLTTCGMLGGGLTKNTEARNEIAKASASAATGFYYFDIAYAIDSIVAIIFTLSGKRFKNPLIIRFISDK